MPDTPGVYFFKKGRTVLYVGKATSLRDRVRSYFVLDIAEVRSALIAQMVAEATTVTWEETDSVLEALILESAEIKKRQPKYNTREKDNKSFNYVVITNEEYPRVFTVRERELLKGDTKEYKTTFGPFPHSGQLKEALKIVRKIFPFRGKNDPVHSSKKRRSRLYEQIGLAPNISTGEVSAKDYNKTIKHITLFFEGKKKKLLKDLERDMKRAAKTEAFEYAEVLRRQIFALQHIQDVALIGNSYSGVLENSGIRIEGYDVAHTSEKNRVGVMTVIEGDEKVKSDYKKFLIKTADAGDTAALAEILSRRLAHPEWQLPKLIVVDGGAQQKNAAEKVLADVGVMIPVIAVTKNTQHRVERLQGDRELSTKYEDSILLANSEAHRFAVAFHRKKRNTL